VRAARVGDAQEEDREGGSMRQHIFHGRACFLATIRARLLKRGLGGRDAPLGAIVATRGEEAAGDSAAAGGLVGDPGSSVGMTRAAASASVPPIRRASSYKNQLGASPRARRVACSTTSST
jgi:hypothetical protein